MKNNKFQRKIISFILILVIFLFTVLQTYAMPDSFESFSMERFFQILTESTEKSVNVPILMYHHLSDDTYLDTVVIPETFENHIKTLADNGYNGIFFEQLVDYVENDGELPENPIIITFDDGYLSNYELAYPILKKYNMKATIFVIGIAVGKDTYRDTESEEYPIIPHFDYTQAIEMTESGLISIQSHSYDMHHLKEYEIYLNGQYRYGVLPLENETEEEYTQIFRDDYIRAKTELEIILQTQSTVYSYPFGKYTELSEALLRELGIKATLTVNYGSNKIIKGNPDSLYLLNRYNINNMPSEKLLEIIGQ